MIARGSRPLQVKFILPALTEATDPYWRPTKYSLFPLLGLATLAAYLSPDDRAVIVDEHVEPLTLDSGPELVVIQVYITNAYRAYRIADHYRELGAFVCLGGLHVTSLPDEAAAHAHAIFLGPKRACLVESALKAPQLVSRLDHEPGSSLQSSDWCRRRICMSRQNNDQKT